MNLNDPDQLDRPTHARPYGDLSIDELRAEHAYCVEHTKSAPTAHARETARLDMEQVTRELNRRQRFLAECFGLTA